MSSFKYPSLIVNSFDFMLIINFAKIIECSEFVSDLEI
jgi:hypothetical protein